MLWVDTSLAANTDGVLLPNCIRTSSLRKRLAPINLRATGYPAAQAARQPSALCLA